MTVSGVDPIFLAQKNLQSCRQNTRQLLPGNHPATHLQFVDSNRSHDRVPVLAQIRTTRVHNHTKRASTLMRRQDKSKNLIN